MWFALFGPFPINLQSFYLVLLVHDLVSEFVRIILSWVILVDFLDPACHWKIVLQSCDPTCCWWTRKWIVGKARKAFCNLSFASKKACCAASLRGVLEVNNQQKRSLALLGAGVKSVEPPMNCLTPPNVVGFVPLQRRWKGTDIQYRLVTYHCVVVITGVLIRHAFTVPFQWIHPLLFLHMVNNKGNCSVIFSMDIENNRTDCLLVILLTTQEKLSFSWVASHVTWCCDWLPSGSNLGCLCRCAAPSGVCGYYYHLISVWCSVWMHSASCWLFVTRVIQHAGCLSRLEC